MFFKEKGSLWSLMFRTLGKIFSRYFEIFLLETICMKCQNLFFLGKIRKISPICRLLN